MFNYAGAEFDFGNVVYAVLTECEHRRRALDPENAAEHLRKTAVARLDRIAAAYTGADVYWQELRREVEETALPRYLRGAVEQLRAEHSGYSIWRRGDLLARLSFALMGLMIGGIIIALPFIPIFEEAFAFFLAVGGFVYPDIRRLLTDWRYARELNAIIADAQKFQARLASGYVTPEVLEDVLRLPE